MYFQTTVPQFRRSETSVYRRFSDFLGLHDKLVDKYMTQGRIVPPAPEKSVIGKTKFVNEIADKFTYCVSGVCHRIGLNHNIKLILFFVFNGIGMTKIKMSKEEAGSQEFVEKRRAALERYVSMTTKSRKKALKVIHTIINTR